MPAQICQQRQEIKVEEQLVCEHCDTTNDVAVHPCATVCDECNDGLYYYCCSCGDHNANEYANYSPSMEKYCSDCFYEYFEYCYRCSDTFDRDDLSWSNDEYYCYNCTPNEREDMGVEDKSVPSSSRVSDTFVYPIRSLVGLEIECIVPDRESMDTPMFWGNVSDGSIGTDGDGMGVEMVSTPANGDFLMDNINLLTMWRDTYEAWINHTCGFHVHFNSIDKSARDVAHIAIVYQKYQKILKAMMPNSRQSSNWCRDSEMNINALRNVDSETDLIDEYYESMGNEPSTDKYNDARYCGINIHSRYYHGTIEFRLHSGTINKEKIVNWISILNCIILKGEEISKFSDENFESWVKLRPNLDIFGQTLKSYMCKRISKFKQLRGE